MINKGKNKILIIVVIVLVITSIIGIILASNRKIDGDQIPTDGDSNLEIKKDIVILEDENTYFSIQNIINDYYGKVVSENREVYDLLDPSYIEENNITLDNIYNVINSNYESVSYMATSIYYNPGSSITYYFVNGYLFNQTMEDEYSYEENVNYLVIVNNNSNYYIRPLDSSVDIEISSRSYNISNIKITNNYKLKKINIREEKKLETYINCFFNLLFLDTKKAYNMLDADTLNRFKNYDEFERQISNIYNSLSTSVFSYNKKDNVYYIKDKNQNNITIKEVRPMNYYIGFTY